MAPIALFFCLVFIAWLLVRDSKRHTSTSAALWLPTLLVLILGSRNPSQWIGAINSGNDVPISDQVFYLLTIGGSWIIASRRGVNWHKLLTANIAIMMFYIYFVLSIFWSNHPLDSLIRISKDIGTTILVIAVILSEKNPQEAIRTVYTRCACVLFPLSFFFMKYTFQGFGRSFAKNGEPMFTGVATQKNSFGELILICSFFLIWDHLETHPERAKRLLGGIRWDCVLLLLLGVWLLNAVGSKTSLVSLIVGVALLVSKRFDSRSLSRVVLLIALSLPFFLLLTQEFGSSLEPILGLLGRDATFTGRTDIWRHIGLTTVNPLVGA